MDVEMFDDTGFYAIEDKDMKKDEEQNILFEEEQFFQNFFQNLPPELLNSMNGIDFAEEDILACGDSLSTTINNVTNPPPIQNDGHQKQDHLVPGNSPYDLRMFPSNQATFLWDDLLNPVSPSANEGFLSKHLYGKAGNTIYMNDLSNASEGGSSPRSSEDIGDDLDLMSLISDESQTHSGSDIFQKQTSAPQVPTRRRKRKGRHLWEFLLDVLSNRMYNPSLIRWIDKETGHFKIEKSQEVAKLWGKRKQKEKMSYEYMSRAMRHYYSNGILQRVFGKRLVYQFGEGAIGWKDIANISP